MGELQALSYAYNTDKTHLLNVAGAVTGDAGKHGFVAPGGDYQYDANGNLTYDEGKNITIKYNYLNLPREIIASCERGGGGNSQNALAPLQKSEGPHEAGLPRIFLFLCGCLTAHGQFFHNWRFALRY
ncbi:MAG: hypothetical protein EPO28_08585 [Saprospiraceae bacterium]|nr:MAG: hypothetical protein EPO28_08585 [Saprospiraceae bacterium]